MGRLTYAADCIVRPSVLQILRALQHGDWRGLYRQACRSKRQADFQRVNALNLGLEDAFQLIQTGDQFLKLIVGMVGHSSQTL